MKISFDLDDTIIPGIKTFETEPQTLIHRIFGIEKMRKGTIELFKALKTQNHSVGIYTTSFRSVYKIKLLFLLNGFSIFSNANILDNRVIENITIIKIISEKGLPKFLFVLIINIPRIYIKSILQQPIIY